METSFYSPWNLQLWLCLSVQAFFTPRAVYRAVFSSDGTWRWKFFFSFFFFTFSLHPCLQCDRIWFLPAHSSVCSCIREISAAVTKWNWALMWWCELGWLCVCVLCQLYNRLTDLPHANWAKLIHFETACVSSVAPFCSFSYSITHFYISFNRIVVFLLFLLVLMVPKIVLTTASNTWASFLSCFSLWRSTHH